MKKIIISFTIVCFLNLTSCYSYQEITIEEFVQTEEYLDLKVRTKDQYTFEFDEGSYTVMEDSIYGSGRKIFKPGDKFGEDFSGSISLKEIESFKFDKLNTIMTVAGIAIGVGILVFIGTSTEVPKVKMF
jgi:hypothetical protein